MVDKSDKLAKVDNLTEVINTLTDWVAYLCLNINIVILYEGLPSLYKSSKGF